MEFFNACSYSSTSKLFFLLVFMGDDDEFCRYLRVCFLSGFSFGNIRFLWVAKREFEDFLVLFLIFSFVFCGEYSFFS